MSLEKITNYKYMIPKSGNMKVPAIIYTSEKLLPFIEKDLSLKQLINVSMLPGIMSFSIGMPDIHQGYAFPIGGVAAFNQEEGVVSPGGVGFDINCGVRVIMTNLLYDGVLPYLQELGKLLFKNIPSGVGSTGKEKFSFDESRRAMKLGLDWTIEKGFATREDREAVEDYGRLEFAEPDFVSKKAIDRGREEFGTLGAGNHFVEIDYVEKVYDELLASRFDLFEGQVLIWIHTGSRGLGHQIATDYLSEMRPIMDKYKIPLFDKDFVSLPIRAEESRKYLGAMAAAANFAWINRQMITYFVRLSFSEIFHRKYDGLGMKLLYDVAHNIAKFERYNIGGRDNLLLVHRKGATRSFPKGHPALKGVFKETGQPVLLPGDMRRGSYILVGNEKSLVETFGSVAHGAGRLLSRSSAIKQVSFEDIKGEMEKNKILLFAANKIVAREEAPIAYKNVDDVVEPIIEEGLANAVVRTKPLLVIKG
jgi:tRNA-splicing ligase RtcB